MALAQIISSLFVLVCVLLHFEVAVGSRAALGCSEILPSNHSVVQRTGQDARNAATLARRYLGIGSSCQQIEGITPGNLTECYRTINLTSISPDSGLQGIANASINLNKLLYMFWFARRSTELSGTTFTEADSAKLDLLEIAFTRLSNQVEWYLQVQPCYCNHTQCAVDEGIDKNRIRAEIQNMQSGNCTHIKSFNVIMQDLRIAAHDIVQSLPNWRNHTLQPYQLCPTVETLRSHCETGKVDCTAK